MAKERPRTSELLVALNEQVPPPVWHRDENDERYIYTKLDNITLSIRIFEEDGMVDGFVNFRKQPGTEYTLSDVALNAYTEMFNSQAVAPLLYGSGTTDTTNNS